MLERSQKLRAWPIFARFGATIVLVGLTLVLRLILGLPAAGFHYLLFLPVVIASAFLFGRDSGFFATITSAALVYLVFMHPDRRHWVGGDQLLGSSIFIIIGFGLSLLMDRLQTALQHLKQMQEASYRGEQEKSLLLQELSHRIRNDLSNVAALLRLQANQAGIEATEAILTAANRVQVLSRLHNRLTLHEGQTLVDLRDFLSDLAGDLQVALIGDRPIALTTKLEPLQVDANIAVSIGLAVNELVTNALKYAFPDSRDGSVEISLKTTGGSVIVGVHDDGVGLGASPVAGQGSGSGSKLIERLARQMGGEFQCQATEPGTRCIMTLPGAALHPSKSLHGPSDRPIREHRG